MNILDDLFKINSFSLDEKDKKTIFQKKLNTIFHYHMKKCKEYRSIIKFIFNPKKNIYYNLDDYPFIHASVFKYKKLISINNLNKLKVFNSSGTTGLKKTEIFLDNFNLENQRKVLNNIVKEFIGEKRMPMIIIDSPKVLENTELSARYAAIQGFSIFAKDKFFILNENGDIDYNKLNLFLKKYRNEKKLIFGFTFQIYKNLISKLKKKRIKYNISNSIVIHGGGWKKMEKIKISNQNFKNSLKKKFGIKNIHNYYGLIEQAGSIFMECECGNFICSIYSDIIIRDENLRVLKNNKKGFIQLLSLVPSSYPGNSILTEDEGQIVSKTCNCGRKGKKFQVHGRVPKAIIRGCSDIGI